MLTRYLARATLLACAGAVLATSGALAAKPKGFPIYKQCTTKTKCSANASSDANGKNLSLNFNSRKCVVFPQVLTSQTFGTLQPNKYGKFSVKNTVMAQSQNDMKYYDVKVTLSGTVHFKKSIIGTYKATTKAPDCSAASQKTTNFHLKFGGLAYGG